jgi:hypothetical protein
VLHYRWSSPKRSKGRSREGLFFRNLIADESLERLKDLTRKEANREDEEKN